MENPSQEARAIANRAKLKEIVEAFVEHHGVIALVNLREMAEKLSIKLQQEMVFDYFFSDNTEIQKTLDRYALFTKGIDRINEEINRNQGKKGHCNNSHTSIDEMTPHELIRRLFDL